MLSRAIPRLIKSFKVEHFWKEIINPHNNEDTMMMPPKSEKMVLKKGKWSPQEDEKLIAYIRKYGIWNWNEMPRAAGLARSGKSCRLRWMNYLRPDIKHGNFSKDEVETIIKLYEMQGSRWAKMAKALPGRSDNEIKNYFNTHLKKRSLKKKAAAATDSQGMEMPTVESKGKAIPASPVLFGDYFSSNFDLSDDEGNWNTQAMEETMSFFESGGELQGSCKQPCPMEWDLNMVENHLLSDDSPNETTENYLLPSAGPTTTLSSDDSMGIPISSNQSTDNSSSSSGHSVAIEASDSQRIAQNNGLLESSDQGIQGWLEQQPIFTGGSYDEFMHTGHMWPTYASNEDVNYDFVVNLWT